jgi:hypothetical protein
VKYEPVSRQSFVSAFGGGKIDARAKRISQRDGISIEKALAAQKVKAQKTNPPTENSTVSTSEKISFPST